MGVACELKGETMEVTSQVKGFEGAWFRAVVESYERRRGRNNITVRYLDLTAEDKSPLYEATSKRFIRPIPPENLFSTCEFEEGNVVEAAHRDGWWVGLFLRKLEDDKYLVFFETPPDLLCFRRKQLRQHFQRTDGKWVRPPHKQPSPNKSGLRCGTIVEIREETEDFKWVKAVIVKEMEDGVTFVVKECRYLSWNDENKPQRIVKLLNIRCLPLSEKSISKRSRGSSTMGSPSSQALGTKKLGCSAMNSNTTSSLTSTQENTSPKKTLPPVRMQNGSRKSSTRENETSEDKNGKRKRQENITCVGNGEETRAKKTTTMVLPFEKKLPIWKTFESMEVFKTNPQTPHFSPLAKRRGSSCEMTAVGMMLTFSGLLEEVTNLQPYNPKSTLESLNDSFTELERHGFNVKAPQLRIHKLMSLKDRQAEKIEEHRGVEKEITEKEREKVENNRKILELQRMNEEADKEIAKMKSSAATIDQELKHVELQFQSTCRSPPK